MIWNYVRRELSAEERGVQSERWSITSVLFGLLVASTQTRLGESKNTSLPPSPGSDICAGGIGRMAGNREKPEREQVFVHGRCVSLGWQCLVHSVENDSVAGLELRRKEG